MRGVRSVIFAALLCTACAQFASNWAPKPARDVASLTARSGAARPPSNYLPSTSLPSEGLAVSTATFASFETGKGSNGDLLPSIAPQKSPA